MYTAKEIFVSLKPTLRNSPGREEKKNKRIKIIKQKLNTYGW